MRLPGRGVRIGLVCGLALALVLRWAVDASDWPDSIVTPLTIPDSNASADAVVVLGGGVVGECVPNLNSVRRTVHGARLLREGRAPLMVVTGGASDGTCPVADAMREFAAELGVAASQMLVERESRSTWENAEFTAPLLRQANVRRLLLVTDRLHMRRAAGAFRRQGFIVEPSSIPIYEGHEDNVSMLEAAARETLGLAYYGLRAWHSPTPRPMNATAQPANASVAATGADTDAFDTAAASEGPIVLLGASYAANWPLPEVGGVAVVNRGVAGQQSSELLERFDRDVTAIHPRAVVLWGFINDIFRATDADMPATLARVRENLSAMIRRARAANIEPVLATELTIRARKTVVDTVMSTVGWMLGRRSHQDRVNELVASVNQWIRETGEREGLLVLDLQRTLADGDGPRKWAFAVDDGSHVSAEGYAALTAYVQPLLTKQFNENGGSRHD